MSVHRSQLHRSTTYILPLSSDRQGNILSSVGASVSWVSHQTQRGHSIEPLSISFECRRTIDRIDASMARISSLILDGGIENTLARNNPVCQPGQVTGHCGNKRGDLSECACDALNRTTSPHLRGQFEDAVISQAIRICSSSVCFVGQEQPNLNIAMFASGGLHGELVLIIRLVKALEAQGFSGTINLFLIDTEYQRSIASASAMVRNLKPNQQFSWNGLIGNRLDLKQFLSEISLVLPPSILVNGTVFGSAETYIKRANGDASFKHDLLIGADIANTGAIFKNIKTSTTRTENPGIVLLKNPRNQPYICSVENRNGQFSCVPI